MKTLLYLLLFVVLGGGAWYFLFYQKGDAFAADGNFGLKDTASVGKIFLASSTGQTITLVRQPDGVWMANEHRAAPYMVGNLLRTLNLQQVMSAVPTQARERVLKAMAGNAIKTEVYDRNGRRIRAFFVGSEAPQSAGTYMLQDGSELPYVVSVTGYTGYLTPRFTPEIAAWRDRTVIGIAAEEIKSVSVSYPGDAASSNFTITRTGPDSTAVAVTGDPALNLDPKKLNRSRVLPYLRIFWRLGAEAFTGGKVGLDSSLREAVATIRIQPKNGPEQVVETYRMSINRRSKNLGNPDGTVMDDYDIDRLYAVFNNRKDTAVIQYRDFNKVFRRSYEFFQDGAEVEPVTR